MKPIKINLHKKNEKDEITKQINELLEKLIVRDPSQWILTHNRGNEPNYFELIFRAVTLL